MSDHNGKRKRVETVDLTADDTDDTDDLDAPARASKRQGVSSTPKSQQRPNANPVGSNMAPQQAFVARHIRSVEIHSQQAMAILSLNDEIG